MEIKQIENLKEALPILWEHDNDLQRVNYPKDSPNYEEFKKRVLREYNEEPEGFFFAYEDDKIIGSLILKIRFNPYRNQKYGEVRFIYLSALARGKGYGAKLLEYADEYFKNKGCGYAFAGISAFNSASEAAFKKVGYKITRYIVEKPY